MDQLDPKLRELFTIEASGDLSAKLAGAPVTDLTRAMGLNELMLTRSELFGGRADEMNQTLSQLNELPDYASAVQLLTQGPARTYNWTDEERRPIARSFVRLVRRRYASR